jgi:plasmid stabilization system protein ParE
MQIKWTRKAEKNLDKILSHVQENFSFAQAEQVYWKIKMTIEKLAEFPDMGRPIGGHAGKRSFVVAGNVVVYEIILQKAPFIAIRNILPRKTKN